MYTINDQSIIKGELYRHQRVALYHTCSLVFPSTCVYIMVPLACCLYCLQPNIAVVYISLVCCYGRSHLVNEALLNHFLDSCDIKTHFVAIKRYLLMEDGEFSHVISSRLCEQLNYSSSSRYLCSPSFLNPLLTFALESSLHGHLPEAQRLAFKLKHQPKLIHTHGELTIQTVLLPRSRVLSAQSRQGRDNYRGGGTLGSPTP